MSPLLDSGPNSIRTAGTVLVDRDAAPAVRLDIDRYALQYCRRTAKIEPPLAAGNVGKRLFRGILRVRRGVLLAPGNGLQNLSGKAFLGWFGKICYASRRFATAEAS